MNENRFREVDRQPLTVPEEELQAAPEFLTARQVADLLQLNHKTVYDLARRGEIPSIKVGGSRRFPRRKLLEALREQTELSTIRSDDVVRP